MNIVYCTTNLINGKKYIGSHNGKNPNYLGSGTNFNKAIKKHGKENFIKQILWEGPSEFRYEMEEYWIEYFNAHNNQMFYNMTEKGVGLGWPKGKKRNNKIDYSKIDYSKRNINYSKIDYKKISLKRTENTDYKKQSAKRKKPILQYDLNGNFIKEWPSCKDASNELKLNHGSLNKCCNNKQLTAYKHIWKYKQ